MVKDVGVEINWNKNIGLKKRTQRQRGNSRLKWTEIALIYGWASERYGPVVSSLL